MNAMQKLLRYAIGGLAALLFFCALPVSAQTPSDAPPPNASPDNGSASSSGSAGRGRHRGGDEDGPRPVFGRIASIDKGTMKITRPDGSETTVKFTDKTEFRKDREPAALKDFKVGDGVLVRGEENPDFSVTAQMVAGRNGNGGPGGGPNRQNPVGTLGKDFIVGQVKAIDAPSLTVVRTDNVTQSFELNEDTSLRKGRDSVTMADIQVGDHVFARGAMQQDQFVPKSVTIIGPEAWKRMQDAGLTTPAAGRATQNVPTPTGKPTGPQN
ncbi:MAG TPA: DUF5666 domain-containing protein [Candidatus Dormibacteraeota bacterium]|nr:DUF5666 domain-containing protein [Candidatus Dormibacteraeota bacterium]